MEGPGTEGFKKSWKIDGIVKDRTVWRQLLGEAKSQLGFEWPHEFKVIT